MSGLKNAGVNRISLGCQTFNDEILVHIGRRHNAKQVIEAVRCAENAGFENINLDFIYGLPSQNLSLFSNDLMQAVELGINHISLYGLKIDEGCYFYSHYPKNLPDNDMQADMYLMAIEILCGAGFEHYEISNFANPDLNHAIILITGIIIPITDSAWQHTVIRTVADIQTMKTLTDI